MTRNAINVNRRVGVVGANNVSHMNSRNAWQLCLSILWPVDRISAYTEGSGQECVRFVLKFRVPAGVKSCREWALIPVPEAMQKPWCPAPFSALSQYRGILYTTVHGGRV